MKHTQVKKGTKFVVNSLPDATIYIAVEQHPVDKFVWKTEYLEKGVAYASGWVDCSIMDKPTKQQLEQV